MADNDDDDDDVNDEAGGFSVGLLLARSSSGLRVGNEEDLVRRWNAAATALGHASQFLNGSAVRVACMCSGVQALRRRFNTRHAYATRHRRLRFVYLEAFSSRAQL